MSRPAVMARIEAGDVLFDGGLGSALIALGLETGRPPEEWNVARPDVIAQLHGEYLDAGSEIIETNSFGGTPGRLRVHGLDGRVGELNAAAVRLAREAVAAVAGGDGAAPSPAGGARFVALSVGPSGEMMAPVGTASPEDVRAEYEAQLRAVAVEPPDLVVVETMLDVRVALIALAAAREVVGVPVVVSMTYNRTPRGFHTVMGDEAAATTARLEAAGADVTGANCSIAGGDMVDLAAVLVAAANRPVLCQPNAGQPGVRDGVPVYDQTPDDFASDAVRVLGAGAAAVGGCCGTTPEFIRRAARAMGRGEGTDR